MIKKQVTIVGAGIGGLVAALALKKKNISSVIYEASPSIEPVGAGIIVSINAMRVFEKLGIADKIKASSHCVNAIAITNSKGHILSRNDLESLSEKCGHTNVAIHRARLHQILLDALANDSVFLNHRCKKINTKENTITFQNGEVVGYELLVASDGISSVVREEVGIRSIIRDAGQICYRGVAKMPDSFMYSHQFLELWGRGKRFGFTAIDDNQVYWYATLNKKYFDDISEENVKNFLFDEYSDWVEIVPKIISQQTQTSILRNDLFDKRPTKVWFNKNIVLLGDAIHPTTPNLGQGAAMAIESAFVLAECLAEKKESVDAFEEYMQLRFKRASAITNQSWHLGRMANLHGNFPCLIRDLVLKLTPDYLINQSAKRVMTYKL